MALAQAVWGIGYTFTSGAEQAWIADEVGAERAAQAFSRARQAAQIASLVGVALAGALGAIDLALPVLVCGVGMLAMAGALPLVMRETGFTPAAHADLSGWQAMLRTASQAVALARRRPIVLWLLISGVVVGLYSEGYDRLWMPHLLQNVGLPDAPALPTATWFAGVRMISALLGIGVVEFTRRRLLASHDQRLRWVLSGAALGHCGGDPGCGLERLFLAGGAGRHHHWAAANGHGAVARCLAESADRRLDRARDGLFGDGAG